MTCSRNKQPCTRESPCVWCMGGLADAVLPELGVAFPGFAQPTGMVPLVPRQEGQPYYPGDLEGDDGRQWHQLSDDAEAESGLPVPSAPSSTSTPAPAPAPIPMTSTPAPAPVPATSTPAPAAVPTTPSGTSVPPPRRAPLPPSALEERRARAGDPGRATPPSPADRDSDLYAAYRAERVEADKLPRRERNERLWAVLEGVAGGDQPPSMGPAAGSFPARRSGDDARDGEGEDPRPAKRSRVSRSRTAGAGDPPLPPSSVPLAGTSAGAVPSASPAASAVAGSPAFASPPFSRGSSTLGREASTPLAAATAWTPSRNLLAVESRLERAVAAVDRFRANSRATRTA